MSRTDRVRVERVRPAAVVPRQPAREGQRLAVQVDDEARQTRLAPGADGKALTATILGGGASTAVRHGLGRVPKGWRIQRATGAAPDFSETARTVDALTFTKLSALSSTVTLWVW